MNAFYFTHRTTARFFAALAMFSLVMGMLPVQAFAVAEIPPADDSEQAPVPGQKPEVEKVKICHASDKGYDGGKKEVDKSSITKEAGHASHVTKAPDGLGDIIPPFGDFPGLNWDAEHQAIWNDNCEVPAVDVCLNIPKIQEAIPAGMVKNEAGECTVPVIVCPFGEPGPDGECHGGGDCLSGTGIYPACNEVPKKEVPVKITVCKEDETGTPLSGWVITVTNNTPKRTFKLTTESDGCVSITVDAQNGPFYAYETMISGWTQEDVIVSPEGALTGTVMADPNVSNTEMCKMNFAIIEPKIVAVPENYTCTFVNSEDDVPPPPVLGCTNEAATNYNPAATVGNLDAENCDFDYQSVCTNPTNLLINGSFEENMGLTSGGWGIFNPVLGWNISNDGLEIWNNLLITPSEGNQNAELDGNSPSTITQTVATVSGATYELRFDFAARSDSSDSADNSIKAAVDGTTLVNQSTTNTKWTTYGGTFVADSSTDVALADMGTPNSLGTLVDNAVLCLVKDPEPVDVCLNIPDLQTVIPEGMVKNEAGECVSPPPVPVPGCTDTDATNFNVEATSDDESCVYQTGGGGNGGNSRRKPEGSVLGISDEIKPTGEVLGAQVTAIPAGAPDAGAGGTSPFSLGFVSIAPVAFLQRLRIHG